LVSGDLRITTKTLYFVRHGETEWNAAARMQGQGNSSLNDVGRRQADDHGRLLSGLGIEALYASPLERARETVAIVRRHIDLEPHYDERIMEWDCGDWSGHLRSEVAERWADEWAALATDPYHYRGPRCENYPDMIARSRPFVTEILSGHAGHIAVVSHGMIGRVMVGILMGFDETEMISFRQPNDVIYRVRLPGGDDPPLLDRYVAGRGPFDGVVPR
jgi:broad specificity phosphatase PhoE